MAKKRRSDAKHDIGELAAHEDSRKRRGEKQEVVARHLGVDPRRLRDAYLRAVRDGDQSAASESAFYGVLHGRLDDHWYGDFEAKNRTHKEFTAALAANPEFVAALAANPELAQRWLEERHQRYRDEERRARGLRTDAELLTRLQAAAERWILLRRLFALVTLRLEQLLHSG